MVVYNLSVGGADGTVYTIVSRNKEQAMNFLQDYDHEGACLELQRRETRAEDSDLIEDIFDPDLIYAELSGETVLG